MNRKFATLTEIIAWADYINHAIVTRDELELGVGRLVADGYVLRVKHGLKPTAKARRLWEQSASKEKRVLAALHRLAEGIHAPAWEPGPLPTTTSEEYIDKSSYEQAVNEYTARFGGKIMGSGAENHKELLEMSTRK